MKKGVYSTVIALSALVIAVAIIASSVQRVSLEEDNGYGKAVIQLKNHWENARYVLDKATSDAIADSIVANGCTYDETMANNNAVNYFAAALGKMWNGQCTIETSGLSGAIGNVSAFAVVRCEIAFGEKLNARYSDRASFNKAVAITTTTPCTFTITDSQSEVEEVNYTGT